MIQPLMPQAPNPKHPSHLTVVVVWGLSASAGYNGPLDPSSLGISLGLQKWVLRAGKKTEVYRFDR
jgi:hypothetical protein